MAVLRISKIKLFVMTIAGVLGVFAPFWHAVNAQEQGLHPKYYRVHNVMADDVLNIRSAPDSSAEIIGSFAPETAPVEVLLHKNGWGYVAAGGQMGWVSTLFLSAIEVPLAGQSPLPDGLSCGGTEPFWGFLLEGGTISYSHMGESDQTFDVVASGGFEGFAGQSGFVQAGGRQAMFTAVINAGRCSDGMSDLDYGWQVDAVLTGVGSTKGYSGCCSLMPNRRQPIR